MKKFVSTFILMLAISPIIVHNLYKYRSKQRNAFEQH